MRRLISGFAGPRPWVLLALALVQFLLGFASGAPGAWALGVVFAAIALWLAWRAGDTSSTDW